MYVREDEEGLKLSHMFKKTFSRSVQVEFLGVWYVSDINCLARQSHPNQETIHLKGHCGICWHHSALPAFHSREHWRSAPTPCVGA